MSRDPAGGVAQDASGQYGPALLDGTDGDDVIIGSDGDDVIDAGDGGNDTLAGASTTTFSSAVTAMTS